MPIQFPNFLSAQLARPDYSGLGDIVSNYYAGKAMPKDDLIKAVQAQFAQPTAEADLQSKKLKNIYQELVNQFTPEDYRSTFRERDAMANMRSMGGGRGGAGLTELNAISSEIKALNPNLTDAQIREAASTYAAGEEMLQDGTRLAPGSFRLNALMNQSYKRGSDVAQRSQERFANTLENLFADADENAADAFEFAGAIGKTKGNIEAAKAQFGKNSQKYENYRKFVDEDVPAIVSEIVRTSGANSTDSQKAMAIQAALPLQMNTNPKIAQASWRELKKLYKTVGRSISQGGANIHANVIRSTALGDSAGRNVYSSNEWEEV